jgi:hypothetical protein
MKNVFGERGIGFAWKIPKGLGVVYIAGRPSNEEEIEQRKKQDERREKWHPNEIALLIHAELVNNIHKEIVVQFWDNLMEMLYDEGPFPVKIKINAVKIEKIIYENKEFKQLFVYFEDYKLLNVNYKNLYYDPMDGYIIRENNLQKFNFSDVNIIEHYEKLNTLEKLSEWRRKL